MDYNVLVGGAAGQGMDTLVSVISKLLQRNGYHLFILQDYMSRVRGGHNYFQIRFSDKSVKSHREELDGIIALNTQTLDLHLGRLDKNGFILADENISLDDDRLINLPAKQIAKEIGNPRIMSSVTLGAMMKLFGITGNLLENIFSQRFNDKITQQNLKAFEAGYDFVENKYELSKGKAGKTMLIQGNHAVALGALSAGLKFYSAYPMTPSTSIMSYLVQNASKTGIVTEQAEDEIAAINMAIGASYAGVRAMAGTSGGGFSLMTEALGLAGITEVPIVIAVVQRPGPATGFPTRTEQADLKFVINASQGEFGRMVIALKNPEDAYYQTARAFNLAEKYQIPVILLSDQYLSDAVQTIEPFDLDKIKINRHFADTDPYKKGKEYKRYEITKSGISPRLVPGDVEGTAVVIDSDEHDEHGHITESSETRIAMVEKRHRKFELLKTELIEPDFMGDKDAGVLLIGWGSMHSQLSEAITLLNKDSKKGYAALVFGDIWPLPQKTIVEKVAKAKTIINVEQNHTGQLAGIIREATGIKIDNSILRFDGRPISAQEIVRKTKEIEDEQ